MKLPIFPAIGCALLGAAMFATVPLAQSASGSSVPAVPIGGGTAAGKAPERAASKVKSEAAVVSAFAAPVMLKAGDKNLGEGRLYPSPAMHDMNGDGLADIVVGDLFGRLTVAHRIKGEGPVRYGEEVKLLDFEGKELKFNNW